MKSAYLVLKNGTIPQDIEGDFFGADLGAWRIIQEGLHLSGAIGDFDSVDETQFQLIQKEAKQLVVLNSEKDFSDTYMALKHIFGLGYTEVTVLTEMSGRFDHTYANLQLLRHFPTVKILDECNFIQLLQSGEHIINKLSYPYISFFSLEKGLISLNGFKYPLDSYCLSEQDTLCLSNELVNDQGTVVCQMPVICIQSNDA